MQTGSPYALVSEMLETPGILRRFAAVGVADWARAISVKGRLFLTGEGSSRIFPAKNLVSLSFRRGGGWQICTEGARQAAEYNLNGFVVIGASNSGRTRELVALFEKLVQLDIPLYGVTASAGSKLTELVDESVILSCGPEKATAATKSVVEQALVLQALLGGDEWRHQARAADYCEEILSRELSPEIIDCVSDASTVYFAGRNNGVAEELALKTNEIIRKKSGFLEGTYALHGIGEVMHKGEVVILIEPFREEMEKYQEVLEKRAGVRVVAISSLDTPFPTIRLPRLDGFDSYLQLMAGWNALVAAGLACGINLDKTVRARKIGNEI